MHQFADYLDSIAKADTIDGLLSTFSQFAKPYGVDQVSYLNFSIHEDNAPICRNDYSEVWTTYYYEQAYYDIDPVFKQGQKANLPFTWSQSNSFDKRQQKLMSEAQEFGICQGMTIPSRTSGFKTAFITLVSDQSEKEFKNIQEHGAEVLHLMSLHLDAKFVELFTPPVDVRELTRRELECLQWSAKGKTNPEMAEILNISEKTVEAHLSNVFKKLSVFSKTQAVVKGLSLGLVFP